MRRMWLGVVSEKETILGKLERKERRQSRIRERGMVDESFRLC